MYDILSYNMVSNIQIVKKAREMRLSGKSLREISEIIGVSKSILSIWLRDIKLTNDQINEIKFRVKDRMSRGRMNASIIKKSERLFKEKRIFDIESKQFHKLIKDPVFISGLSLYWAKGSFKNNHFQFTCSDNNMLIFMRKWILKYLNIDNNLIIETDFLSYKRLNINRIEVLRRVMAWQKLLIQYYEGVE